jgi:hypothetical protein
VVVVVGDMEVEPVKATLPILWLIVTVVASVTTQLKVALSPSPMVVESAVKELIMGLVGVIPLQPDKNMKSKIVRKNFK